MENVEKKIENQKTQIKNLEAKNKKLKDTNIDLQSAIIDLKCENKKLEDSKDNLMTFIKRQYEVIQSITEKHNTEIVNAQKIINEKNKTISGLEHDCKHLKVGNDLLENNIDARDREIKKLKEQLEEKNKENDKLLCRSLTLENAYDDTYEMYERQKTELEAKDKDIQALMDQLDARDREIEKYKFMVINMADDLYGKGDLDRGEEDDD